MNEEKAFEKRSEELNDRIIYSEAKKRVQDTYVFIIYISRKLYILVLKVFRVIAIFNVSLREFLRRKLIVMDGLMNTDANLIKYNSLPVSL